MIKNSIYCYRNADFSNMREDARENILSIYNDDGKKPHRFAKLQVSTHLILMGRYLNDNRLLRLATQALMVDSKIEVTSILKRTQEVLREK